jgi:hypothetical protein
MSRQVLLSSLLNLNGRRGRVVGWKEKSGQDGKDEGSNGKMDDAFRRTKALEPPVAIVGRKMCVGKASAAAAVAAAAATRAHAPRAHKRRMTGWRNEAM